ncbi:MAG: aminoglycoside phosphotransferase family protein [Saprospiraceae bacterium]|nr:aminoglycoside phosphotransferase family protein [Saprospiraceae bacterium]
MYEKLIPILQNFLDTEGGVFFETIQSGHINETYKVTIGKTHYILQRINTHIFPEPQKIMENIETVAHHLKSKNYTRSVLDFVKTQNNQSWAKDTEGGAWRLLRYVENTYSILKIETEQQAFTAAKAFGEYISYLSDLDVSKIHTILPNFHNADFRIQQHRDALYRPPSVFRLEKAAKDLVFIQQHVPYFEKKQLNIPLRVTHNDTKISNILFDKTSNEAACIIDLDTLQTSTLLADFGDMVRTYTSAYDEDFRDFSKVKMRFSYFKALSLGFIENLSGKIMEEEQKNLVYGAERTVFVQILRFMTDYLNDDIYYKTHYDEHNLVRAQNQIALFKSMLKQRDKMEKLIRNINT